jgi:hypothetical protein
VQALHVWVVPSQIGVVPEQSALARQVTHVALAVWQSGVVPVQAVVFVAEHWAHAPDAWQAGVAPPHSASLAQARHAWVAVLQTGVVPAQVALETQGTQVPVVV